MQDKSPQKGSRLRTLIRPKLDNDPLVTLNIFQTLESNQEPQQSTAMHKLVGDHALKQRIFAEKHPKLVNSNLQETIQLETTPRTDKHLSSISDNLSQMRTQQTQYKNFCLDQIDHDMREKRSLALLAQTQSKWKDTQSSLMRKTGRQKSISFSAVKNMYLHPNPEKLYLINDDIPLYWQHSLRDNNKRLKNYLQNTPYKKEIAEEMLQTLAGQRKLQQSIPPINPQCKELKLKGIQVVRNPQGLKKKFSPHEEPYKVAYENRSRWLNEISMTETMFSNKSSF